MNEQVHTHFMNKAHRRMQLEHELYIVDRQSCIYRLKEKQSTCDLFLIIDFHYKSILPSIGNFYNKIPLLFAIKRNKAITDDRQRISLYTILRSCM
jgi:hypothetical protein